MKKYLILSLVLLLVVTGCGKAKKSVLVCSSNNDGITSKFTMILKNKKVEEITASLVFFDKEYADIYCSMYSNMNGVTCKDKEIVFTDLSLFDISEVTIGMSKDDAIKNLEEAGFKCK